jgi:poly [ADP-ribose] polymerase
VEISQTYANDELFAIDTTYLFPLDERAAVCGFEADIAGRKIVGEVKEKQQAKRYFCCIFAL